MAKATIHCDLEQHDGRNVDSLLRIQRVSSVPVHVAMTQDPMRWEGPNYPGIIDFGKLEGTIWGTNPSNKYCSANFEVHCHIASGDMYIRTELSRRFQRDMPKISLEPVFVNFPSVYESAASHIPVTTLTVSGLEIIMEPGYAGGSRQGMVIRIGGRRYFARNGIFVDARKAPANPDDIVRTVAGRVISAAVSA